MHAIESDMQRTVIRDTGRHPNGRRRSGLGRTSAVAVLVATVALVATGCGRNDEPQRAVAEVTPSTSPSANAQAGSGAGDPRLAYARCMRENGMPDFPDPEPGGGLALPEGVDPNSKEFKEVEG